MRNIFANILLEEAKKNRNIELITGDLGSGVLDNFINELPNQFINAGIAEQNMTGVAAGMAKEGKTVFTYSIGNFPTMRCLEQIRNDCAYHNLNVKIVCIGGGFVYGALGMSHHATEDLAIMRALPNVIVTAPGDLAEAEAITREIIKIEGTCYLRLGKGGEKRIHEDISNYKLGDAIKVAEGEKVAIFSTGAILEEALNSAKMLNDEGISTALVSFPTIKPIDKNTILEYARKCDLIVTVEEHNIIGGLGSAVAEIIAENNTKSKLLRIGLNDEYSAKIGKQDYLRAHYKINSKNIVERIKMTIQIG